jgi:pyruvate carboxylase subunit B
VTQELKDYLQGLYGRPPVPADHELRRLVLGREEPITIRPADLLEPQVENSRQQVRKMGYEATDDNVLIHLMFPSLAQEYLNGPPAKDSNGSKPQPAAPAPEPPVAAPEVPDPPPAAPISTAEFDVEVEGEVFKVRVTGAGMTVTPAASAAAATTTAPPPKTGEGTVIAPMQGLIVKIPVKAGDVVKLGDVVAVLEAMKMQNDIVTTVAGRVSQVYVKEGEVVSPNQPLLAVG